MSPFLFIVFWLGTNALEIEMVCMSMFSWDGFIKDDLFSVINTRDLASDHPNDLPNPACLGILSHTHAIKKRQWTG
jgi:hypothetical protein